MVGTADPLGKAAGALRCADVDHQIDVAPVDAHVERRRRDNRLQLVGGHGGLDLAPLPDIQRAVMQRDRQRVFVYAPEFLKHHFGLAARVDEQQRYVVCLDQLVDVGNGIT